MKIQNKLWFTLVELIVVITILAILWTIAFISLQWYSRDTRNSVRISDLSNINKMIWVKIAETWKVPAPDDYINITASWTTLIYQWQAWKRVLDVLWVFNWWKDPLDETYYTYSTNTNLTKYELLWFLEWNSIANLNLLDKINAETNLSTRQVRTKWDDLWIILDSDTNQPITEAIDVLNTTDIYKTVFIDEEIIEWTWWVLFTHFYNRSEELLKNKNFAIEDECLVWYWDMQTTTMSWSQIVLKDLSQYWNNGECYQSWALVDCWWAMWPQFVDWWMYFNWIDKQWLEILDNEVMEYWWNWTILIKFNMTWLSWLDVGSFDYAKFLTKDDTSDLCSYTYTYNAHVSLLINPSYTWSYLNFDGWYGSNVCDEGFSAIFDSENKKIEYNKNYTLVETFLNWNYNFNLNWIDTYSENNWTFILKNTPDNWKIWAWHAFYLNWIIDEIRIYNRSLSDFEIQTLYETIN